MFVRLSAWVRDSKRICSWETTKLGGTRLRNRSILGCGTSLAPGRRIGPTEAHEKARSEPVSEKARSEPGSEKARSELLRLMNLCSTWPLGGRGNFTFTPGQNVQLQYNTAYFKQSQRSTDVGPDGFGYNVHRGVANYWNSEDPAVLSEILDIDIRTTIERFDC